jgi:imidazolonepropionase-like amidohydrolase
MRTALAAALVTIFPLAAVAEPIAITHVTVVNTATGALQRDVTVAIDGARIVHVGPAAAPAGWKVVDGRGKFLIPGLWDMHAHLSWTGASALPLLIANGITGVRDLGGRLTELDDWRSRIDAGVLVGPRIIRVGPILNGKSFNRYQFVPGNAEQTRAVARLLKFIGVDYLKVHRRMERDSYFALIDEAKVLGLQVVGHIPMTVSPAEASDAGQSTIEHVATLFEGTFGAATALSRRRSNSGELPMQTRCSLGSSRTGRRSIPRSSRIFRAMSTRTARMSRTPSNSKQTSGRRLLPQN